MQRVMIIGCGGTGKSTLARHMGAITGLPVIHLDQHYWQPGWVSLDKASWEKRVRELMDKPRWIMDGNYGGTMDLRMEQSDTIIFLDRSRWICLYRVVRRTLGNLGRTRPDLAPNCPERFTWEFLTYIYRYNRTRRPGILRKLKTMNDHKKIYHLLSDREMQQFLDGLGERGDNTSSPL